MDREIVDLEMARIVRQAFQAVVLKIQAQQLGEAFTPEQQEEPDGQSPIQDGPQL